MKGRRITDHPAGGNPDFSTRDVIELPAKPIPANNMNQPVKQTDLLRAKLNQETSQIAWKELQRYYAAGMVIAVSDDLDLVDVAASVANDDTAAVSRWMSEARMSKVTDVQASAWLNADAALWAVVVKPWILVQMRAS